MGLCFAAEFFETDYASFLAWRDWDIPDATVQNCFAMGAIKGADGAFVLGIMGDHTANAGSIYFPCGMTDPQSVDGTSVNLEASLWREVAEETGLTSCRSHCRTLLAHRIPGFAHRAHQNTTRA